VKPITFEGLNIQDEDAMAFFEILQRVAYAETDQMGLMHHSNYLKWYENARWELFRHLGISYAGIEQEGYILPVTEASLRYLHPLRYDQEVAVVLRVRSVSGARITFEGEMRDAQGVTVNRSVIGVGCARKEEGKATPLPPEVRETLSLWMQSPEG
jgi:acyl-CoA thioester hydrolase